MSQQATDWKVLYGELRQFAAYFDDRGRAERFARDHHSDTIIPLTPAGARLLGVLVQAAGENAATRLLALSPASLDTLYRRMSKQALVEDAHFHDARATALTHMSRKMDVLTLARISGHRDLSLVLTTYYRESAADVSARLARPSASRR